MKRWIFHDLDAMHLNVGIPVLITLVLFFVNYEIFAVIFTEEIILIFKYYFYIMFSILVVKLLLTKKQKTKKKFLRLSFYEFGVLSSVSILLFLSLNFTCSKEIYRNKYLVNFQLLNELETLPEKPKYFKILTLNPEEIELYYKKGYTINFEIHESCFGLEFIKSRTFEKI